MKTRKLTAILLALCMLLSLSISAFAADDAVVSGTIPDSKITWELDGKGWLTISGSGDCSAFTSKDDQPWAEYRGQITQVWFDGMERSPISLTGSRTVPISRLPRSPAPRQSSAGTPFITAHC